MSITRGPVRSVVRTVRGLKARVEIAAIRVGRSATMAAIKKAVEETIAAAQSPEEAAIISRIERRRQVLLNSRDTLALVDYGAGSASSHRSEQEMRSGVQSTAPLSRVTSASKPPFWAFLLLKLIRHLHPSSCLELGSCVGISASYQAAGLRLNGRGRLVTLEGSPEVARIARETLAELGIDNASVVTGPFYQTYGDSLASAAPVDFLFNDGHHDRDALLKYFEQSLPHLARESVIVFDDISWSAGMREAWREIEQDTRVAATVDLGMIGIAVLTEQDIERRRYKAPLSPALWPSAPSFRRERSVTR